MTTSLKLGDLPSWITVLLIGLGIMWAASNGVPRSEYESWGQIMMLGAGGLGAFYFLSDIGRKI
jgi:hypothetical protein